MFQVQTNSLEVSRQTPLGENLSYSSIFDEIDEVVWSIDVNTKKIVYLNKAAEKLYGREMQAFYNNPELRLETIINQERNRVSNYFAEVVKTKNKLETVYQIIKPSGEIRTVRDKSWAIADEEGKPQQMISLVKDITPKVSVSSDRQKIEKERNELIISMAKGEARYRSVLSAMSDGIIVQNAEGLILECNTSAERILGLSTEEIMGMKTLSVGGNAIAENGSPLPKAEQPLSLTRKTGKPIKNAVMGITKPDGTVTWILVNTQPLLSPGSKKFSGIVASLKDITELHQAQKALKISNERLQLALEAANDGIWDWNLNTGELYLSDRWKQILGYNNSEIANTMAFWQQLLHPEDRQVVLNSLNNHLAGNSADFQAEYRMQTKSGDWKWILARAKVVESDFTGKPVRVIGTQRDISDRKQGELAIAQSEVRYRELARREALLNRLSSLIRHSLDLDTILETTVRKIYNYLHVDICAFGWYRHEIAAPAWEILKEAKHPEKKSILGTYPAELYQEISIKLLQLETYQLDDLSNAADLPLQELLISLGATALISLPIATTSGRLGSLHCLRCGENQSWQTEDLELLQAVATQLAIAINQAFLYTQSQEATRQAEAKTQQLEQTLIQLQSTQTQLVQTEKMSSLGQMVAGIAHEINNPVSFIYGNISHAIEYTADLLNIIELYQDTYSQPTPEIEAEIEASDLDFLIADLPKLLDSMKVGAVRIKEIVQSLRTFSRLDEAEMKAVDLHENIDSTIMILQNRIKAKSDRPEIIIKKNYGDLPKVECYAGQLNQVFMNLISNAIDALEERSPQAALGYSTLREPLRGTSSPAEYAQSRPVEEIQAEPSLITISTVILPQNRVQIRIADNGNGMNQETLTRIFDPFYTTKPIGKGTGLGLSISHSIIVEKHRGSLRCVSELGVGTEFAIEIPIHPLS